MREQGLQLKAKEGIVHATNDEAKESYEQLSSIQLTPVTVKKQEVTSIDIADAGDEKVQQFSMMMKDTFMQALMEYGERSTWELKENIKKEVDIAVEEKVNEIREQEEAKGESYYRKLDEALREVQQMRKEMSEVKPEEKKQKNSFFGRFFKEKGQAAEF